MAIPDPTFTIMALGPFCPVGESGFSTRIVPARTATLEEAMTALAPRLWNPVPAALCPEGGLTLTPGRIEDLLPESLIQKTPYLKDLQDAGAWIESAAAGGIPPATIAARVRDNWPALPLDLAPPADGESTPTESAVDDLLAMVALPGGEDRSDAGAGGPPSWKIQADGLLAANVSCIFENQDFRTFEATWRGAEIVMGQGIAPARRGTRLSLVPVAPSGLADALDDLTERLTDRPPNLILIDMPFDQSPRSLDLLERVARFAENLLAPAAVWITPAFLHLPRWDDLHRLPMLKNHIDGAAYAKWRRLMARPDGCWLAATCNRFLTRSPYGNHRRPRLVSFEEQEPLWINPVWALATLAAQSIETFGWPSRFTDQGNIRLRHLIVRDLPDRERIVTEALISDERIRQCIEIGVTPLSGPAGKAVAFMPEETTVAGESLASQLFLSRVIGFLLRCREGSSESGEGPDPATFLYQALTDLFRRTGYDPPADLSVKAGVSIADGPIPLEIAFTPPRQIPP